MKIPFDIKFRPQIESGEYKVETEEGSPARIICWDSPIDKERPIIAIVFDDQIEQYKADGRYDNDYETSNYDLFIVTPEEEMTEDESITAEIVDFIQRNAERGDDIMKSAGWVAYLERQKEYIEDIRQFAYNKGLVDAEEKQKPVNLDEDVELGLDRALQIIKDAKENLSAYQSDDGIYECDHAIQTLEHILKNGIEQNPAEWSEEDEEQLKGIIDLLPGLTNLHAWLFIIKQRLQSLHSQPHWKPSKEQMEALRISYEIGTANASWAMCVLKTLYSDLKKL